MIIQEAVDVLASNGVLLHATDTVWGLAANAFSPAAVEKIYTIKQRDRDKPLILLVSDLEMLKRYVPSIHPRIETLLALHERPLTVIYKHAENIPEYLLNEDDTIGIRVVQDAFSAEMIRELGYPIASTSANISGDPIPHTLGEISPTLKEKVDLIITERADEVLDGPPSVIITYNKKGKIKFLRS